MKIGEKIKELRMQNNLSQEDLASCCKVKQSAVSKWERGATVPSAEVVANLAKFFKVSAGYLLGIENL